MANKTMTLTDISKTSKQFKDTHTLQVGGFKDTRGKLTAADVQKELRESVDIILREIKTTKLDLMNAIINLDKKLTARIDNLVSKNNLKE